MKRLGLSLRALPILALVKIAGGLGLVIGQWNEKVLTAASVSLTAYFAVAVTALLRARDVTRSIAPAGVWMLVSIVVFAGSLSKVLFQGDAPV